MPISLAFSSPDGPLMRFASPPGEKCRPGNRLPTERCYGAE